VSDLRTRLLRAGSVGLRGVTGVTGVTGDPVTPENLNGYNGYAGYVSKQEVLKHATGNDDQGVTRKFSQHEVRQLASIPSGLPEDWREGLARLPVLSPPAGFTEARWAVGVWWARKLAHEHGVAAFVMGWNAEDLFGLDPVAPAARYDGMGLAFLLRLGSTIMCLDDERAITRAPSGAKHRFPRRRTSQVSRPAWNLRLCIF
jgi:hypothetical protein